LGHSYTSPFFLILSSNEPPRNGVKGEPAQATVDS
jgi:hypothetical protein